MTHWILLLLVSFFCLGVLEGRDTSWFEYLTLVHSLHIWCLFRPAELISVNYWRRLGCFRVEPSSTILFTRTQFISFWNPKTNFTNLVKNQLRCSNYLRLVAFLGAFVVWVVQNALGPFVGMRSENSCLRNWKIWSIDISYLIRKVVRGLSFMHCTVFARRWYRFYEIKVQILR